MFKIKYAKDIDSEILGEIHSKSWKAAYKNIIPDKILDNITSQKRASYFKRALTEGWEEDAIIYKNDYAIGLICIGKCRDRDLDNSFGEIWGIYLLPEFWNLGIGSILINWGINELKSRGYSKVTLWVLENNLNAIKFYKKHGFIHDGTVKEIYIGKTLNEYRYLKEIK
ncbi:MAG: GNAT family N-acetyltransferase [Clostridium sp.]|uniref:GNAT family N-acetyltransferase n=1 Tax=Clostridium sp. TaxID=1506 RepID=UPI002A74D5C0|nr:GNAT family N-acetyltransferase [Clostridium sp.]MDY2630620.1 GNAT family N-acetyltransferase [Clostridium sp.]MDY6227213.1 GNAT family N-acetyltransferase [Clostridium sp.]